MRKTLLVLLAVTTVAAACSSDSPNPSMAPSPSQRPRAEPDCPNQDVTTSSIGSVRAESLAGDVDGDRADDTVFLAADPEASEGCRAFVVVDTGTGRLAEEISDPDISFDLGLPTLEGTVQIDGRPGDEIIVRIMTGASTLFVGLFTVHEGELERIEVAGPSEYGNLFPSGGSVGHLEGSDCTEDGIVVTLALPKERGYEVTRSFYTLDDARAEPGERDVSYVWPRNLDKFPELAGPPFSHCGAEE